jgi:hypothetical protein
MTTNPTKLRSALKHEDVEKHRSLSCTEYDGCLDVVLRRSWSGWSCARCQLFPFSRERQAAEVRHAAVERHVA